MKCRFLAVAVLMVFTFAFLNLVGCFPDNPIRITDHFFSDDFAQDAGNWIYVGSAVRDEENGYVVLTQAVDHQVGVIWLTMPIDFPFMVELRYKAGGGTGADGFVVMFYKDRNYIPDGGGDLGFDDGTNPAPGYGIEFDNWKNPECDPDHRHIAFVKDFCCDHLSWVHDERVEDFQWHYVEIWVTNLAYSAKSLVEVFVDGDRVLKWKGILDKAFGWFGIGAATGYHNNWHIIDDIKIYRVLQ